MTALDVFRAYGSFGARLAPRGERSEIRSFGDPHREAATLARYAAVVPRTALSTWHVTGKDAQAFLHRMLSQDVKTLAPGRARWSCFLTVQGKVLGDPLVWNLGDRFALTLDAVAAAKAIPSLERYVIADDVVFTDASDAWTHFAMSGRTVADAITSFPCAAPEPGSFLRATIGGVDVLVLRRDLGKRPAFHVMAPSAEAVRVFRAILRAPLVEPAGEDAWDVARVETGIPAFGAEIDDRILPNEAGLDDAVSFTKGCYLGQEPVVMAKHRGRPPTRLVRLAFEGNGVPPRDTPLALPVEGGGGATVGRVTTAVVSATRPGVLALAFVKHDVAAVGLRLSVAGPSPTSATIEALLPP